jgi:hypothetical protein
MNRNLRTRLVNRFRDKYRFMGGEEITQFIVDDILSIVNENFRSKNLLSKGQILWDGIEVKQKRKPGRGLSMRETRTKPIVLTLISEKDIKKLQDGFRFKDVRKDIIERITTEAYAQGTVLNQIDIGLLVAHSHCTIRKAIKDRETEKNIQLPTRGRIHDLGPGVTHKKEIMKMLKLLKYPVLEVKRRTNHSTEAVERYHRDYNRVETLKSRLSPQEMAFVTGLSEGLVKEYLALMENIENQKKTGG